MSGRAPPPGWPPARLPSPPLEAVVAASLDGVLAYDRELRCVLWNLALEALTGVPADDVIGRDLLDTFPFLVANGDATLFAETLAGRIVRSPVRSFYVPSSGRSGYYEAQHSPWRGQGGEDSEVLGGIAVVRDVTAARHDEQLLRETEGRFRNMADASPVLLWMSRADGLCTFFNQTWLDFTGRTLEEEWGVGWADGVHFQDFQHCMDTYVDAFNARRLFEIEYRLRRKDGEYRWILDRGAPRYTPDGTFAGFIGSCVDITERRVLEGDLRRAVRVRDEFLSIASHELRTPLTSVQLRVEGLLRNVRMAPERLYVSGRLERDVAGALDQVLHLGRMIDVLLDSRRIAEERLTFDYAEVDVAALVRAVADRMSQPAVEAACALRIDIPEAPELRAGRWDRLRVDQLVTNLLSNAIKYGAGKPIDLRLQRVGDRARITVTDQGPGIAVEQQARLFERFARLASSRHYGGFGLGLWIAREIVRAHDGSISVESQEGDGASFIVELPLAAGKAAPP